ncbi:MAG: sensor histidine kinase [Leptospiraceae bacterium]|nr:sensor histidine kinase [Leptospiraceae bacterium]
MVDLESAYRLYANGKLIGTNGRPGKSQVTETPEWRPAVHVFFAEQNVELILHVSNHHHRWGGVWEQPILGTEQQLRTDQNRRIALEVFVAAAILAVGVYHLLIFVLRRNEIPFLLLGLFCFIMALRTAITGERILQEFWSFGWNWLVTLDYLTVYIGAPICHWYLVQIYHKDYSRKVFQIFAVLSLICAAIVLFTAPSVFTHIADAYHLLLVSVSVFFTCVTIIAIYRKREDASLMFVAWLIFTLANFNDILYVQALIDSRYLSAFGLLEFLFIQSYILAKRYSRALHTSERLRQRVRNLLTLTRTLNQSRNAIDAIRTALNEGANALGTPDTIAMRALFKDPVTGQYMTIDSNENRLPEKVSNKNIEKYWQLPKIQLNQLQMVANIEQSSLRSAARRNEETLAVLEWCNVLPQSIQQEKVYIRGLCDSLALVLENIRSTRTETLAAVGQAASEIVHDINHHCRVLLMQSDKIRSSKNGDVSTVAGDIDREVTRLKNMALDILDFARQHIIVSTRPESLQDIARSIEQDLRDLFTGTSIIFSVEYYENQDILIDLDRFQRVTANLARNAATAMPLGGEFRVRIEVQDDRVYFIFEDNGPGLSSELRNRLFQPFPGSNSKKDSFGLGLAVVDRIVRAHNGEIFVYSRKGQGTRFTIVLPAK